jgi:hypothetical protein
VAEATGWLDLASYPPGTRASCRRERPHPGAKPAFTDTQGRRYQVLLTDQPDTDLARLELRHRQHARIEDRIRTAKATGWPGCRLTAGAATRCGFSWSWPLKT